MARSGKFITLEGSEGVGKSTNLAFVADYLTARGIVVVQTREPGGTGLGEKIRELLLHRDEAQMTDEAELLLMFAARSAHLVQVIRPALDRGDWVVCDRFTDASYAYQGGGRGIDSRAIADLEEFVQGEFRPDLTIWLDADPQVTENRRAERGADDRFEAEASEFFARVRATYAERAAAEPDRIRRVDAGGSLDEVRNELADMLEKYLKKIS